MTMSSFRIAPRKGHLEIAKRIVGYLAKHPEGTIRYRTEIPDYSDLPNVEYDWDRTPYSDKEDVAHDFPEALGNDVVCTTYYDANLFHNKVTGHSVTACIEYLNKTIIDFSSRKQPTVETATFGSEAVAGRTAVDRAKELRLTLRYMGIPIRGPTIVFGDNESVVQSASIPHGRLHKRHTMLSIFRMRDAIASNWLRIFFIPGNQNPADILSKIWGYSQVWHLLRPLLFWEGDTMDLFEPDSIQKG
jgi:hypothetical protein